MGRIAALLAVLVVACPSARAATRLSATADVGWQRAGNGPAGNTNSIAGSGSVLLSFGQPGANLQIGGGGAKAFSGGSGTLWLGDADLFWRDSKGVVGASVSHGSIAVAGLNPSLTAYGGFAEWFASDRFTMRLKGGGFSGDASGYYGGAGAEFYIHPFAGLFAEGDYVHMTGLSTWTGGGGVEFMLSSSVPLSIRAGSSYTTAPGAHSTAFFVGLKYRFGLGGTLIDMDRSGPVSWNGAMSLE